MPLVESKDFNALIDNKPFSEQPVKTNKKYTKNLLKCQETMTIQNLLDYLYYQKYYKLIGTDLSRQTNTGIPQQINSQENLKKMMVQQCFLLLKSGKKLF